jgi:hypothetical protein
MAAACQPSIAANNCGKSDSIGYFAEIVNEMTPFIG